jgi:hypothetical protein
MEMTRDTVEISVVIYPQDGIWIAQGIEHDIAAHGETPVEASERFNTKVRAELVVSWDLDEAEPLSGIESAPSRFAEMYRRAKMRIVDEDVSLEGAEGPPKLRPHIKITNERQAA